jgi:hypothetical protein
VLLASGVGFEPAGSPEWGRGNHPYL